MNIAIAGTGYVGLSNGVLLAQHNKVTALDIVPEKVELLNSGISPIVDREIETYLAEKELNFTATLDPGLTRWKKLRKRFIPEICLQGINVLCRSARHCLGRLSQ